jgi:EAL and modified HD-GYP domain-containing signal transduction protein
LAAERQSVGGLRRPLLDRDGRLAGFEHGLPGRADAASAGMKGQDLGAVETADAAWVVGSMATTVAAGRRALAVLPTEVLGRPTILERVRPGMMFALPDAPFLLPERQQLLAELRRRGAALGSSGVPRAGASFVVFDASALDRQGLLDRARACRAAAPGSQVLATGIRTLDDLEAALHGGFEMAAGLFDRATLRHDGGALAPDLQRICRMIQQVMDDEETTALAREIRADVGLTYRLLRHANSPLLGLTRAVDSVDQALQLLGRQTLYRWLTMLLVVGSDARPTSMALQEIALARARMMERMAPAVEAPPEALFTTGMLSLLDVMTQLPMAQALAPLALHEHARAALVNGSGPWRVLIDLARCLEAGQMAQADELAAAVGGLDRVQTEMADAWIWAAEMTRSLKVQPQ